MQDFIQAARDFIRDEILDELQGREYRLFVNPDYQRRVLQIVLSTADFQHGVAASITFARCDVANMRPGLACRLSGRVRTWALLMLNAMAQGYYRLGETEAAPEIAFCSPNAFETHQHQLRDEEVIDTDDRVWCRSCLNEVVAAKWTHHNRAAHGDLASYSREKPRVPPRAAWSGP